LGERFNRTFLFGFGYDGEGGVLLLWGGEGLGQRGYTCTMLTHETLEELLDINKRDENIKKFSIYHAAFLSVLLGPVLPIWTNLIRIQIRLFSLQ
jgi:hypothetical protein